MRKTLTGFVLASALCALSGMLAQVHAADQGITGKKLLLKTGKVVLISKDPTISVTGSDPIGGSDSSVSFNAGSGAVTFSMPKILWTGTTALFKYKNPVAPGGASPVKIAKLKQGLLKIVAKGLPFAVPNGAATINVEVSLDGGSNTYCMTFSGTGDGSKFLVKDAAAALCAWAPACCEASSYCGGTTAGACGVLFPGSTPVGGGAVCDASGNCSIAIVGAGTLGGCCQISTPVTACAMPSNPTDCASGLGSYSSNSSCTADGTCTQCGDNVREGAEWCDGSDDDLCPGFCLANCTCEIP